MIPSLIIFSLFTGWGVFGYVMHRADNFHFYQYDWRMIPLMALFGLVYGTGVYAVAKLLGLA